MRPQIGRTSIQWLTVTRVCCLHTGQATGPPDLQRNRRDIGSTENPIGFVFRTTRAKAVESATRHDMENTSVVINEAIPASSPTRSTAILVIDDDPEIRLLLQTAIEWQICSIQSDIAAIVCDMEMPVMGGLAFIEKIARLKPKARVIVSTGGDEANLGRAKRFKVVRATLPKPYSIPDFWATLERVL